MGFLFFFSGPALAVELYEKMCSDYDPSNSSVFHMRACKCDFLATVRQSRVAVHSRQGEPTPCIKGFADTGDGEKYPCHNSQLLSRTSIPDLIGEHHSDGIFVNDIWGWVGPGGEEIALVGLMDRAAFVDVTDPVNPQVLGVVMYKGPKPTYWSDIKAYDNYAYIVSENIGNGLQVCCSSLTLFRCRIQ